MTNSTKITFDNPGQAVGVFVLAVAIITALGLWQAFAAQLLWQWFIVPLGVRDISLAHMFGITLLVGVFRVQRKNADVDVFMSFLAPGIVVVFGYMTRTWM